MEYKGYYIYACVTNIELWTIDENGDTKDFEENCISHYDLAPDVRYDIQDASGSHLIEAKDFGTAKAWVDKLEAEATA